MTEDEISDLRLWEVEMFDHINQRLTAYMDPVRRNHPSCHPDGAELREIIEVADAFPPTRWW